MAKKVDVKVSFEIWDVMHEVGSVVMRNLMVI